MSSSHFTSVLGPAAVGDDDLAAMVADLLGHDDVEVVTASATPVDYDVPSITTVSRHWVHGTARTPAGVEPWRMFVKHVQAWKHSPFFAMVPEHVREMAASTLPWRIESLVYRSDLADRLPAGLTMPRCLAVHEIDPDAAVVWLEAVEHEPVAWTPARYERAAHLLGRLAGSPRVAERADVGQFAWSVHDYVVGRVQFQVAPRVMDDAEWRRPDVAEHFDDDVRDRVRAVVGRLDDHCAELVAQPRLASHGDASPNNLLPGANSDDFVLIDFGFFMPQPVGFDLGQLVAGEVQLGLGPWQDLPALDAACVAAYTRGLAVEGVDVDEEVVRRAHALHLAIFAGISSLPDEGMTSQQVAARAALARHSMDLLEQTGG